MKNILVLNDNEKILRSFSVRFDAEKYAREVKRLNPEQKIYIAEITARVNFEPVIQDLEGFLDNFPPTLIKSTQVNKIKLNGEEEKGETFISNDPVLSNNSVSFEDLTEEKIKHSMIALHQKWGFFDKKMLVSSLARKEYEEVGEKYIRKVNRPIPKLLKVLKLQQSNIPVKGVTLHYVIHRTEEELNQARKYFRKVG